MAFCTKCGNQLSDGAQFCTACGQPTAAEAPAPAPTPEPLDAAAQPAPGSATPTPPPPPAYQQPAYPQPAAAKKRSPLVWLIPVLIVGLIVVGVGGWFAFTMLSGGTQSSRAKAQIETVADFFEAMGKADVEGAQRALPADLADGIEEYLSGGEMEETEAEVSRKWDGEVLVLTATYAGLEGEEDESSSVRVSADGEKPVGTVVMEQADTDSEWTTELTLEMEDGRWVITEIDGTPIDEALGLGTDDGSESSDDSSDGSSSSSEEEECWSNQRTIEGAAQQYYAAEAENYFSDLEGEVDDMHLLTGNYLAEAPRCPADGSYYWLFDDGTTGCPSGEHGYYLDEE